MSKTIKIGGRIESAEQGGVVTGANAIFDDTKGKKQNVINSETDDELARLDSAKQDVLTFDNAPTENSANPVKSGGVYAADAALQQAIEAILQLIPSAATAMNQLADKAFVNSTEATNTATFRGTYNVVTDLSLHYNSTHQEIATALLSVVQTADNNDYCFVQIPVNDSSGDIRVTERYKFNGTAWSYEYDLNNSGFTADQWAAINSTITLALVQKLGALPTAAELAQQLALKQNTLTFDTAPVAGSSNPVTSGGLYNVIAAINATIPSGASVDNKLVAESRLTQYVAAIVNALDATFNVTSTDGHVNVRLTQVDGAITSVEVITNDIASAAALNTLAGRVTTNEGDIAQLQALYNALQQSAPVIIQPTDTWPVANPSATVIYRVIDRVNTPPQYYSDYMFSANDLTTPVLMAQYNNAVDAVPTAGSHNLVESGGVYDGLDAINVKFDGGAFTGSFEYPNYKPTIDNLDILAGKVSVTISTGTASYFGYKLFDENDNVLAEISDLLILANEPHTNVHEVQSDVKKIVFTANTSQVAFTISVTSDAGLDDVIPSMKDDIKELQDEVQNKVTKDYGKNLLIECTKGKALQGGNIVDAADRYGITNPVYFDEHDAITCNNCATGGYYAVVYGQNDTVIGQIMFVTQVTTIKKTDYTGAVYVRFTIFTDVLGSQEGAIKTQIQYGEKVTSWCPNSDIQGKQIEYHEVTCNSDTLSGADFTGNDAIKNAIASITDASYFKRYVLKCTGEFKGTKPSDYSIDPYGINPQYAMFWLKDYIYLDGGNAQDCVISGTLPDSLAECQADTPSFVKADYGVYQPLFLAHYPAQIKNITLIARNTRYPLHIDPANNQGAWYGDTLVENCRLIHEGKYGDSIGTIGGSPSGFGFANGAKYTFRKCLFMGSGLYYHDTPVIDTKIQVVFEDCQVVFKNYSITNGICVVSFNNIIGSSLTIRNCQFPKNAFLYFENAVGVGTDDMVDVNNVDFSSDGEPMPIHNGGDDCRALRIESAADGASVRFDETSSAFDVIVGDSSRTILQETNRYNRHEQYGYQWRDGGTNVKGEAIGYRNLASSSMGARLGDCSTTAKTLGIIVNGTTYSVVFNRDYTSVDNETILEEINAVLNGVAIAGLYLVCRDYYPTFRHTSWYPVDDSNSILSGMGVIFTSTGGIRRATSSDGYIDGVAVDAGVNGSMIRVIEKGRLKFSNNNAPGIRVTPSTPNYWDIPYGTKLCIDSDNDGVFAIGNSNAVLKKLFNDSVEIL